MAEQHGGYRKPNHPAPVSGPGAMSQRTDGRPGDRQAMRDLPDAGYGERKNLREIQGGADMAAAAGQPAPPSVIPLNAETQRPDEPVTAGNPLGEGVGPQGAGVDTRTTVQQDADALKTFLPLLEFMANRPGAPASSRMFVRTIKGNMTT